MKTSKRAQRDVKELMSLFTTDGIKPGDLVITFEIHRVKSEWKKGWVPHEQRTIRHLSVATLREDGTEPRGTRIMQVKQGQQGVMKLESGIVEDIIELRKRPS